MPQLHFSVDAATADQIHVRARQAGLTVSRYLARLVRAQIGRAWPEGYLEAVVGSCADTPLVEPDELPLDDVAL